MSVIVVEGFDLYNGTGTLTGVQARWTPTNMGSPSMQTGRFGGQCLRATTSATGTSNGACNYARALGSNVTSACIGFAFRSATISDNRTAGSVIAGFALAASGVQCSIGVDSSGRIVAWRGTASTLLGTGAAQAIFANTWHYIEAEIVIDGSVGRITVYVDGVQALNLTAQNTKQQTGSGADTFQILCDGALAAANGRDFDDLYIVDAASKLGQRRVETLYPTSDVAQGFGRSTGTANFSLVNEAQANGDTNYVQGTTVSDTDTYGLGDLSSTPSNVDAVQVSAFAEKTDATSRSIALQVKSGATTSDGSNFALAASYGKFERLLTTDPNTSAAWAAAAVNALQGGPKVTV